MVLEHRIEAGRLLGLVVSINRRFLNERVERGGRELLPLPALLACYCLILRVMASLSERALEHLLDKRRLLDAALSRFLPQALVGRG